MEGDKSHDRANADRPKPFVSRTRLIMILLLAVALPIFINLANKAVNENADSIQKLLGH
jgi:hypothetical protein